MELWECKFVVKITILIQLKSIIIIIIAGLPPTNDYVIESYPSVQQYVPIKFRIYFVE